MKAAVLYEFNRPLVVEEISQRPPGPGEVRLRIVASGVCHTDLAIIEDRLPTAFQVPIVLGHEGAGIVEEVGPGVTTVAPGDHAVLSWIPQCGRCYYCTIGRPNLCMTARTRAASGPPTLSKDGRAINQFGPGSFAHQSVVPEEACIRIRQDAPLDRVCLVACAVMTGVGAVVNTARVRAGSSVLVIGCGGVGLNVVQGAVLAGAGMIIAVDIYDHKLALARQFGATHTLNGREGDLVARVKDLTGGLGVEYAFEAIATGPTIRQAFDALAPGGRCVVVGAAPRGTEVPIPAQAFFEEKVITGTRYGSARMRVDIPRLVDLYMDRRLRLDELVSQVLPLEEVNKAFDDLRAGAVARTVLTYGH